MYNIRESKWKSIGCGRCWNIALGPGCVAGKKIGHGRHSRLHWDMHTAGEKFVKLLGGRFVNNAPLYTEMSSSHQYPYCPKAPPTAQGLNTNSTGLADHVTDATTMQQLMPQLLILNQKI